MSQAVSCRPVTAEALVQFQVFPCWVCGERSGNGTGFPPNTLVFPLSVTFHHALHSSMCSYQTYKWAMPENLPKSNVLYEKGASGKNILPTSLFVVKGFIKCYEKYNLILIDLRILCIFYYVRKM